MISKVALQEIIKQQIKSESDLSRKLGVSRQAVNTWLNKECVTYDKLFDLVQAIGLEIDLVIKDKEV